MPFLDLKVGVHNGHPSGKVFFFVSVEWFSGISVFFVCFFKLLKGSFGLFEVGLYKVLSQCGAYSRLRSSRPQI